ncbi:hypothetical protein CPB85DRAFT_1300706 [Mucidula mucida]|nr:hypothetical protein CPB85DRAFT_1300706 [Mucidula mucida]
MTVEKQPAKRTGMSPCKSHPLKPSFSNRHFIAHPEAENEETIGEKVVTSYGEGAAEEVGKKTVEYAADPESGAQEHIDNVKVSRSYLYVQRNTFIDNSMHRDGGQRRFHAAQMQSELRPRNEKISIVFRTRTREVKVNCHRRKRYRCCPVTRLIAQNVAFFFS